eukprot:s66_g36.t1
MAMMRLDRSRQVERDGYVDRVSADCPAMAMVLWGSSLNSVPPPRKPTEVGGDQYLPPAVPIDESLHVQPRVSDGDEPLLLDGSETCRRARMNTGDFGVPSLDTRQSYFSNSFPKRPEVPAAPNRILHNHHKARIEHMMKDSLFSSSRASRRKLQKEVASRRQPDLHEDAKKASSPKPRGWNFTRPWRYSDQLSGPKKSSAEIKKMVKEFVREMVKGKEMNVLRVDGSLMEVKCGLTRTLDALKIKSGGETRNLRLGDVEKVLHGAPDELNDLSTPLDDACATLLLPEECISFKFVDAKKAELFTLCMNLFIDGIRKGK